MNSTAPDFTGAAPFSGGAHKYPLKFSVLIQRSESESQWGWDPGPLPVYSKTKVDVKKRTTQQAGCSGCSGRLFNLFVCLLICFCLNIIGTRSKIHSYSLINEII